MTKTVRISLALLAVFAAAASASAAEKDVYVEHVKPLLMQHCVRCHGPLKQESKLRLDAASLIRKGGEIGEPLIAEKSEDSFLIKVLTGEAGFVMPPDRDPLSKEEIEIIANWIRAGAPAPADEKIVDDPKKHWSYQPPVRAALPTIKDAAWVKNPIDAFVAAKHEELGLAPQQPAPKHVLLRRIYLDLTGVPPTPEELRAFLADDSPGAYAAVVDRLLESPRYGERWGRHWMDVWRYSDWYGYQAELRNSARHIWRWRDWIVDSLNDDKPYNRMVVEMLAADELEPGNREILPATGYLARNYYKFNRDVWLDDTVEHTSKAFLGMTMNCARCHDHMYDPIAQQEYYQFRAIFEPYQVRIDRVPGQSETEKDGISLAYDAALDTPTYLYIRGNDKSPDKEHPLAPTAPSVLAGLKYDVQPVENPPEMFYPGSLGFVREEALAAANAELNKSREAQASASTELESSRKKRDELAATSAGASTELNAAETALATAEKSIAVTQLEHTAAEAGLASVQARIDADVARYTQPAAPNVDELAKKADELERVAMLSKAEAVMTRAQFNRDLAEKTAADGQEKSKKALAEADEKLATAKKQLDEAKEKSAKVDNEYESLTPVYPKTSTGRRLALAKWITDDANPLFARVAVNHIWARHFGKPLVPTMFDFGLNGKPASHPELLDWLAVELKESGWSMKHLHRLIVLSNAYQMDSLPSAEGSQNIAVDPDNKYLWRMNSRRMEAEAVRDSVLAVAGSLDATMGGAELDAELGQTTYRRSIYYRHAPEKFMTFLKLFDSASTHECYRRDETVVPQQALAMINSPLSIEQSRRLATKLNEQVGGEAGENENETAFVDALFERVLCRPATSQEQAICARFLDEQSTRLASTSTLTAFDAGVEVAVKPAEDAKLRARENLTHVLLNHNEFVTVR